MNPYRSLSLLSLCAASFATAQSYLIPDPAFAAILEQYVPAAMSGNVLTTTHPDVLAVTHMTTNFAGITSLDGLQFFQSLESFACVENQITYVPPLPASLHEFNCSRNQLTALPPLLEGLELLNVSENQFSVLPELPASLLSLACSFNPLTSLPSLNDGLLEVHCEYCLLTELPALPSTLDRIYCDYNLLSSLPALPPALTFLSCNDNQLTALPTLPNSISLLYCQNNLLTTIPNVPDSIVTLHCHHNLITSLPSMANSAMHNLMCYNNQLTQLPALPPTLGQFWCHDNPLKCFPPLPNSLYNLSCINTDITCLPNIPTAFDSTMFWADFPAQVCDVATSDCMIREETISGKVFNDLDGDGTLDPGEPPFLLANVEAQPGDFLTAPDHDGNYVLHVNTGTYTLQGQPVLYHLRTTDPVSTTLTLFGSDTLRHIGYQIVPDMYDVLADLIAQPSVPGFITVVNLGVQNVGTETTSASIQFTFDADLDWNESGIAPATLVGNEATWSATLAPGELWSTLVYLHTDSTVGMGTPIEHVLTALIPEVDQTPQNNTDTDPSVVLASMDPNDKVVRPEELSPDQLLNGDRVEYTIRFQNTGTFPAQRVVITDTLSGDLQWNTLDMGSSSHPCTWYLASGVLYIVFDPIALPDSATNEAGSHGHVRFTVRPGSELALGESVSNTANIYFDFNAPVITAPAIFTVLLPEGITGSVGSTGEAFPNPFTELTRLVFHTQVSPDRIELLDVHGHLLRTLPCSGSPEVVLRRDGLEPGLYLVRMSAEGTSLASVRLVVY